MDNETSIITAEKIIEKSKQWTLEGDCTLLQWMDQMSKNLELRVTKTTSALNDLSISLDRTSVALSNATNNLAALQYSQFVENRVHDDDETLANIAEVPNPARDVTDNKAARNDIYSFLKKNLEMMNSCHEAYAISYDDSDEDEPATNVVYRSNNPYEVRSLPHIYGSNLWKEKWHIGLCDSDNDFSGDENSEQFSESSSTADDSYESTAPTMSEWDSTAWGLNNNHLADRKEIHTPSNDGESSYQGEILSQSEVSTPRNLAIVQPIQDQKYYQHVPRKEENLFDDIFTDAQPKVVQQVVAPKRISHESLIANEPPPDVEPDESDINRRIGAKKPLNLFDDDEFSSFMDQIVQTATNKNVRPISPPEEKQEPPKKRVVPNLFDDSEEIFTPKASEPLVARRKDASPKLEDDIFMPPPLPAVVEKTKIRNLFDDEDGDDDFESIFAAKPSGSNQFTQKTKNLFEDDAEDLTPSESVSSEQNKVKEATVKEVPLMRKGLFDDEDDLVDEDDIFARKRGKKDLFEKAFSKGEKDDPVKNVSHLKDELFGDVEEEELDQDVTKNEANTKDGPTKSADLFADVFQEEPPDDIFAPVPDRKTTKISDIFAEDFTDDFEEFIPKVPQGAPADKSDSGEISSDLEPTTANVKPIRTLPDIARKPDVHSIVENAPEEAKIFTEEAVVPAEAVFTEESVEEDTHSSSPTTDFEDKSPITQISEDPKIEKQPSAAVSNYTTLFQDEPPPDDEDPSYDEPPKYTEDEDLVATTPPVAPYSSLNLFADVPPDDDFSIVPPVETKRIHSIFYDDFNETIEASREMRAPSTYIFNEEPPPDDDLQSPNKVVEDKPSVVEQKQDKPKVSKLKKMDFQINVGALLPTARIPSFKKPESGTEPIDVARKVDTVPIVKTPVPRDLPENILPNLNRDRAKVQVKRRPSTRKGRQESYRKSMIEDENTAIEEYDGGFDVRHRTAVRQTPERASLFEESDIFVKKSTESLSPVSQISVLKVSDTDAGNIFEALRPNKEKEPASKVLGSLFESKGFEDNSILPKATVEATPKPSEKSSLFDESDSAEEKPTIPAFKPSKGPLKQSPKPSSLFGESDDGSDDLFKEPKVVKKPAPQKTIEKKSKPKPVSQPAKPAASLFSSDEESGSGDDIFGKSKTKAVPKKVDSAKAKPSASLFADLSDDDDDDLFGTAKKKPSGVEKSKSKPTTNTSQPTKTSAMAQQQTATSNNPLADLLGP